MRELLNLYIQMIVGSIILLLPIATVGILTWYIFDDKDITLIVSIFTAFIWVPLAIYLFKEEIDNLS